MLTVWLSGFQVLLEVVGEAGEEVMACLSAKYAVVPVCIYLHVELLACLYQCFGVFGQVAEVYVVIGHAVYEEQFAVQLVCMGHGRALLVSVAVLLGGTHVSFGIYGVVELPACGCCHGYSGFEDGASFAHGHEGVESAVAPSPDAYARLVDVGECTEVDGCLYLVLGLFDAQVQVGALLEGSSSSACAPSVNAYGDEPLACPVGFQQGAVAAEACGPAVLHLLRARAGVLVHDDGVFL